MADFNLTLTARDLDISAIITISENSAINENIENILIPE